MRIIGSYSIPVVVFLAGILILLSKKDLFYEFLKGTKEGISTTFKILPNLIVLMCAVKMFSASGALDIICSMFYGITNFLKIPNELVPLLTVRPISGSAATAMTNELFSSVGPDSFAGRCACVIMGSTDTIIYTLSLYFGAVGVKKTRYALPASFILYAFNIIISVIITHIFF